MGLAETGKCTLNADNTSPWTGVLDCVKRRKQATHQHPSLPPDMDATCATLTICLMLIPPRLAHLRL